jgi:hypothetical protein
MLVNLLLYLVNFIKYIPNKHYNIVALVIALALYLDNFPLGAHSEFIGN